jgi:hypothetical protein
MLLSCVQLLVVLCVLFVPGYLLARNLLEDADTEALLPTGFALGVLVAGVFAFANLLAFGRPGPWVLLELALLCAGLAFRARKRGLSLKPPCGPLLAFLAFCAVCLVVQAATPSHNAAYTADWKLYLGNFFVYAGQAEPGRLGEGVALEYFAKRTPLYSVLHGFVFGTGLMPWNTYVTVQFLSVVINGSLFWGLFALARLAKPRPLLLLVALPLTPLLLRQICASTPKALMAFLVLEAGLLYLSIRRLDAGTPVPKGRVAALALVVVAAYLTHPAAILTLGWIAVDQVQLRVRAGRPIRWSLGIAVLGVVVLLALPWHLWVASVIGTEKAFAPSQTVTAPTSVVDYAVQRGTMLVTTLAVPSVLADVIRDSGSTHQWANALLRFYWESFLGGFTLVGWLLFLIAWRRRKDTAAVVPAELRLLLIGCALGAATALLVHVAPDPKGHAANIMLPLHLTAFAAGWIFVEAHLGRRVLLALVLGAEGALVLGLQVYATVGRPKLLDYLFGRFAPWTTLEVVALVGLGLVSFGAYLRALRVPAE